FAVYSKTGAVLRPATEINQLWANTNSECKTHNEGDPVVVYDQLANRWLLTQFIAATGEQYGECNRDLDDRRRDRFLLPVHVLVRLGRLLRLPEDRSLAGPLLHDRERVPDQHGHVCRHG